MAQPEPPATEGANDGADDPLPDGSSTIVPAISGSIAEMKALRDRCLEAGIAAIVGCPPGAGKGCGPRTHLLVEQDELPRVIELFRDEWRSDLAREGLDVIAVPVDEDTEHPPCPACGTAAPLVEGACSDCGLQLE
jgi:hypothetical protein